MKAVRRKFEKAWGVSLSPEPGLTLMEMMKGIAEGKIKALFILGENPLLTDPNANRVKEELAHLDLLVVQDIFLSETGGTGPRGPSGGEFRRKGRDLHQHRAPSPAGPPRSSTRSETLVPTGRSSVTFPPAWAIRWATTLPLRSWRKLLP